MLISTYPPDDIVIFSAPPSMIVASIKPIEIPPVFSSNTELFTTTIQTPGSTLVDHSNEPSEYVPTTVIGSESLDDSG